MKNYTEFTGKTLDAAISDACSFYGVEREKLEIEIISDAKSGIFGLVGVKKAVIRARKVNFEHLDFSLPDKKEKNTERQSKKQTQEQPVKSAERKTAHQTATPEKKPVAEAEPLPKAKARQRKDKTEQAEQAASQNKNSRQTQGKSNRGSRSTEKKRTHEHRVKDKVVPKPQEAEVLPEFDDSMPSIPLEEMDQQLLCSTVLEATGMLTRAIIGDNEKSCDVSDGRVRVHLDCAENSGLIIGRDGQTLASLQYLVSCIVSRRLNASIRVQVDAGDYRERQDEKLRELALALAQKVKSGSKPQSTRPLSAYHRRIIHMTLQDSPDVQTHSKGEGSLKRVIIVPRRRPAAG